MIRGNFDDQARLAAEKIVIKIPTPPNTARVRISTLTMGRTKYNAQKNAIFWKISEMNGDGKAGNGHAKIKAEVIMMSSMSDKVWSRPPISVDFHIGMHTASGLHVRYLQVSEAYDTAKWVRYQTRAGNYNVRI
jgi:AP-2 complex subunit mu-1